MSRFVKRVWMWMGLSVVLASVGTAQEPAPAGGSDKADGTGGKPAALAIRQEGISGEVDELERKILRLIQELQAAEPEQALRLAAVLKQSREKGVNKRILAIVELLKTMRLDSAAQEQGQVIADLVAILDAMTAEEDPYDERRARIEQLERWNATLAELSREEWALKRESEKTSDADEARLDLAALIERLERLRREQAGILERTEEAREKGELDLRSMQQKQQEVREETETLIKDLVALAGRTQGRPDSFSLEPGQKALEKAVGHQKSSETALGKSLSKSAAQEEQKALEYMDEALAELRREKDRLADLPKDHPKALAKQQDNVENKAGGLEQEMESSEAAEPGKDEPSETSPNSPGKGPLSKARKAMQSASESLQQGQPGAAGKEQEEAHAELEKARDEVQKELRRLQNEERDAFLSELIALFKDMLDRQIPITLATAELEAKRAQTWGRAEEVRCGVLAGEEKELGKQAEKAASMLASHGSPEIFSFAVDSLRQDLTAVESRLGQQQTDRPTQTLQQQIEQTLRDLVEAMEQAQRDPPPPEDSDSSMPPQPPRVSDLAQFKLLRAMQQGVNHRTKSYDTLREAGAGDALPAEGAALAARQQAIAKVAQDYVRRLESHGQEAPQQPPQPEDWL